MNLEALRDYTRRFILGDPGGVLWSDDDLDLALNKAEQEVARLTLCLTAEKTLTLSADTAEYSYPAGVLLVYRARVTNYTGRNMEILTLEEMDARANDWNGTDDTTDSEPKRLINAWPTDSKLTINPIPTATSVAAYPSIKLGCYALPSTDMSDKTDTPEVNARYHLDMCDRAAAMCWQKEGIDTKKPEKEAEYLAKFMEKMEQAKIEVNRLRRGFRAPFIKDF